MILTQLYMIKLELDFLSPNLSAKKTRTPTKFFRATQANLFRVQLKFAFRIRPLKCEPVKRHLHV